MSFMLICGKIFHCLNCGKEVRVDYKGGPLITQIGDFRIIEVLELSKIYGQPNSNPDMDGYFLHDVGLCESCYILKVDYIERERSREIFDLINQISTLRNKTQESISSLIPNIFNTVAFKMTVEDIQSAINNSFDPYLGDKHATPQKRRRLFNDFINRNKEVLTSYILKKTLEEPQIS